MINRDKKMIGPLFKSVNIEENQNLLVINKWSYWGREKWAFSVYIISVVLDSVFPNFVKSKNRLAANIQTTSIKAVLSLHVFIIIK